MDSRFVSLDTETYGILASEPEQTVFHPRRMFFIDGVHPHDIVKCVSLTLPRKPITEISIQAIADAEPGETMLFDPRKPKDRQQLLRWFLWCYGFFGMNLAFDMLMLRANSPLFAQHLVPHRKQLINLAVLNFLQNPSRPEKSLKNIGLALNTHKYEHTAKNHRFTSWQSAAEYCGEDTHNTLVDCSVICRRILADKHLRNSITSYTLDLYSDTEWSCIQMSENGVPFHRPQLEKVALAQHNICNVRKSICAEHDLQLHGKGSELSKDAFMDKLYTAAITKDPSIKSNPVLGFTTVQGKLQCNEANRDLLTSALDKTHPLWAPAHSWTTWSHSDKLIGTYCFPLLWRRRKINKGKIVRTSLLCPQHGMPFPLLPEPPTCLSEPSLLNESFQSLVESLPQEPSSQGSPSASPESASTQKTSSPPLDSALCSSSSSMSCTTGDTATANCAANSSLNSTRCVSSTPSLGGTAKRLQIQRPKTPLAPNPDVWLSHTSWFLVPTNIKGDNSNTGGTIQGRITCKDGAHQTDPKPLQECWHSRWDGGILLSGDLSQIELRVPAILSGEPLYLNAYNSNEDIHTYTATLFWSKEELFHRYPVLRDQPLKTWKNLSEAFNDKERQVGKRGNFARGYRSGAENIQRAVQGDIGELLPLEIFQRFVNNMKKDTPLLWAWQESMIREARRNGIIVLPITGQSRQFGGEKYDVSEICNFPIQTIAGNVMNCIQAEFRRLTWHIRHFIKPFLNIYDALKIDCASPSHRDEAKAALIKAVEIVESHGYWARLCEHYGHRVPLKMDFKEKPC